jgi:hypothetical protein
VCDSRKVWSESVGGEQCWDGVMCGTDLDLGLNRIVLSKEGLQLTCPYAMSLLQVRSMPIRKDDEVLIVRGKNKGKEGKVVQVSQQPVKIETDRNRY